MPEVDVVVEDDGTATGSTGATTTRKMTTAELHEAGTYDTFYTRQALLRRESMRFHPFVRMFTRALWELCVASFGSRMSKDAYLLLFKNVLKALPRVMQCTDPTAAAAAKSIDERQLEEDWARDRRGCATLGYDEFALAWFQLADQWTNAVDARTTALFMQKVQNEITTDAGGLLEFAFDTSAVRRYVTDEDVQRAQSALLQVLEQVLDPPKQGYRDPRLLKTLRKHQEVFDNFIVRWQRKRKPVLKRPSKPVCAGGQGAPRVDGRVSLFAVGAHAVDKSHHNDRVGPKLCRPATEAAAPGFHVH